MDNYRFAKSYYYATDSQDAAAQKNLREELEKPRELPATQQPSRAQANVPRPKPAPVVAEKPSLPPVESTYFTSGTVPMYYENKYALEQQLTHTTSHEQSQRLESEEPEYQEEVHEQAVPLDYFARNELGRTETRKAVAFVDEEPAEPRARKTYPKMYNAFNKEAVSGYYFEEKVEQPQEPQEFSETETMREQKEYIARAHPSIDASFARLTTAAPTYSSNNASFTNGDESAYIGFKSDVHVAYGANNLPVSYQYQNQPTHTIRPVTKSVAFHDHASEISNSSCTTAMEQTQEYRSRFQPAIREKKFEAPQTYPSNVCRQSETATTRIPVADLPGSAFQRLSVAAPSEYHYNNLNDLVSCVHH